jgi:winged helix DNA-binding protein
MTIADIAKQRLISQQLVGTKFTTAKEMVSHLGAVQAQDYEMAKWAIGIRLSKTAKEIEEAINNGEIIRTHILRPTWHFVSAYDIRWMLALTMPHIKSAYAAAWRNLELDEKIFRRSNAIIQKALTGGDHLTREELMTLLQKKGIFINALRSLHLMFRAELEGIACNGIKRGKQFTYTLLDKRVPSCKILKKEEALAELAKRYFNSHGYATLRDFRWWSGLTAANAKMGLESIKSKLDSVKIDNQIYWVYQTSSTEIKGFESIHFLPAFDEFMVSYKDRSASLDAKMAKHTITSNGIFRPVIVVNGKVEGLWKRTLKKDHVLIEPFFFKVKNKPKKKALAESVNLYADFLGMKTIIKPIAPFNLSESSAISE